jgi:hypothetical protein
MDNMPIMRDDVLISARLGSIPETVCLASQKPSRGIDS